MVKQKIVVNLTGMGDAKKRSKALQSAAGMEGVISTSLEDDRIVVVGDGLDPVALTITLRNKLGFADLVSVSKVGDDKKENKQERGESVQQVCLPYDYIVVPPHPYPYPYPDKYQEARQDPACCSVM